MPEAVDVEAVLAANRDFYEAFEARDLDAMSDVWVHDDEVVCTHPGWKTLHGWGPVAGSWFALFGGPQHLQFILTDERVHLAGELGVGHRRREPDRGAGGRHRGGGQHVPPRRRPLAHGVAPRLACGTHRSPITCRASARNRRTSRACRRACRPGPAHPRGHRRRLHRAGRGGGPAADRPPDRRARRRVRALGVPALRRSPVAAHRRHREHRPAHGCAGRPHRCDAATRRPDRTFRRATRPTCSRR